uniref:Uncharacterized protein n=1 Tax=Oryza barthii TaxID=65489 RepID=A0A0D3GN81_9ORYZ
MPASASTAVLGSSYAPSPTSPRASSPAAATPAPASVTLRRPCPSATVLVGSGKDRWLYVFLPELRSAPNPIRPGRDRAGLSFARASRRASSPSSSPFCRVKPMRFVACASSASTPVVELLTHVQGQQT